MSQGLRPNLRITMLAEDLIKHEEMKAKSTYWHGGGGWGWGWRLWEGE